MILFGLLQEFPMLFWSVKGDFRKGKERSLHGRKKKQLLLKQVHTLIKVKTDYMIV